MAFVAELLTELLCLRLVLTDLLPAEWTTGETTDSQPGRTGENPGDFYTQTHSRTPPTRLCALRRMREINSQDCKWSLITELLATNVWKYTCVFYRRLIEKWVLTGIWMLQERWHFSHAGDDFVVAVFGLDFLPESCRYVRRLAEKSKSLQHFGSWTFCLDRSWGEGHLGCELPLPGLPKDAQHDKRKVYCVKEESCNGPVKVKAVCLFYCQWLCR